MQQTSDMMVDDRTQYATARLPTKFDQFTVDGNQVAKSLRYCSSVNCLATVTCMCYDRPNLDLACCVSRSLSKILPRFSSKRAI
jgi:hypothetical protein